MSESSSDTALETLRVAFIDFWKTYDTENNIFTRALRRHYNVVMDQQNPDLMIYSNFGLEHLLWQDHKCLRLFFTPENVAPDFNTCEFAATSCRMDLDGRHLYLPYYLATSCAGELPPLPELDESMARRKFCSFIYSNNINGQGSSLRYQFCKKLMEYSRVDCPGTVLHNMDAPELARRGDASNWHKSKIQYLDRYKFNIAFENSNTPGYITEKLTDAFFGNTVPIYWGSCGDVAPFPREAMIVANDYDNLDDLVARVREVNENDELYMSMLAANPLRHGMTIEPDEIVEKFLISCLNMKPFDKDPHNHGVVARVMPPLVKMARDGGFMHLASLLRLAIKFTRGERRESFEKMLKYLEFLKFVDISPKK